MNSQDVVSKRREDIETRLTHDGEIDVIELDPKEIPPFMQDIPVKVLQHAVTFGLIIWGYTCKNYMEYACETGGYETLLLWGVQGSLKSNRTLAHGHWIYEDWDLVLKNLVYKPSDPDGERGLLQRLKAIPHGKRIPWLGWDDMTVHYPSSTWRTDIKKYEAIDSSWAALRTKVNVVSLNCPLIDRAAKNIKDNATMEVFIGRNQVEMIERFIRLPGLHQIESNLFKAQVEPLKRFEMYDVPTDVFKEYWEERLRLADEALEKLGNVFSRDEIDLDKYVPINVAVKDLGISPNSVTALITHKTIRSRRFNGQLHILKEDYDDILVSYYRDHPTGRPRKRKG